MSDDVSMKEVYMIEADDLRFAFEGIDALNGLSIHVSKGSIYGLIGPNGSGKTTALNVISGAYRPDAGCARIGGEPVFENPAVKRGVRLIPDDQHFSSLRDMRGYQDFYKGVYPSWSEIDFMRMTEAFGLSAKKNLNSFSKGMRKQAAFILAMASRPDTLIMDEPLDGIDPHARKILWRQIIEAVSERGMTALISSHNLRELEGVCDAIGMISGGRMLFESGLDGLRANLHKAQIAMADGQLFETDAPGVAIVSRERFGAVETVIMRGRLEDVEHAVREHNPLLFDMMTVSLEEIFEFALGARLMNSLSKSDKKSGVRGSYMPARALVLDDLRRLWPVLVLGMVCWAVVVFWDVAMSSTTGSLAELRYYMLQGLTHYQGGMVVYATTALFPLLVSVVMTRGLYSRKAAVALHALPYTRGTVFASNLLSGIILTVAPIVVMMMLIHVYVPAAPFYSDLFHYIDSAALGALHAALWRSLGMFALLSIFHLALANFAGMLCGSTVAQVAVYLFMYVALPIGGSIAQSVLVRYLYGYTVVKGWYDWLLALSPFARLLAVLYVDGISGQALAWYAFVSVALCLATALLHARRRIERAGRTFVFRSAETLFVSAAAILCVLLAIFIGGGFFYLHRPPVVPTRSWIIFVIAVGGVCAFFLIMMMVRGSARVFRLRQLVHCAVTIAITAGMFCLVWADPFGFSSRVPQLEDIQSVSVNAYTYWDGAFYNGLRVIPLQHIMDIANDNFWLYQTGVYDDPAQYTEVTFMDEQNIEILRSFHMKILAEEVIPPQGRDAWEFRRVRLMYTMKDGSVTARSWVIPAERLMTDAGMLDLRLSDEYKQKLSVSRMIDSIGGNNPTIDLWLPREQRFSSEYSHNNSIMLDLGEEEEFVNALEKDLDEIDWRSIDKGAGVFIEAGIYVLEESAERRVHTISLTIPLHFSNTIDLLKKTGCYDRLISWQEDIRYMNLVRVSRSDREGAWNTYNLVDDDGGYDPYYLSQLDEIESLTITDPELIRLAMQNGADIKSSTIDRSDYYLAFIYGVDSGTLERREKTLLIREFNLDDPLIQALI